MTVNCPECNEPTAVYAIAGAELTQFCRKTCAACGTKFTVTVPPDGRRWPLSYSLRSPLRHPDRSHGAAILPKQTLLEG